MKKQKAIVIGTATGLTAGVVKNLLDNNFEVELILEADGNQILLSNFIDGNRAESVNIKYIDSMSESKLSSAIKQIMEANFHWGDPSIISSIIYVPNLSNPKDYKSKEANNSLDKAGKLQVVINTLAELTISLTSSKLLIPFIVQENISDNKDAMATLKLLKLMSATFNSESKSKRLTVSSLEIDQGFTQLYGVPTTYTVSAISRNFGGVLARHFKSVSVRAAKEEIVGELSLESRGQLAFLL